METPMNIELKKLIQAQIKQSFIPEYQSTATDSDALGLMLAHYFEWDGLEILKAAYSALEDSNFHTENRKIDAMIKKLKGQMEVA